MMHQVLLVLSLVVSGADEAADPCDPAKPSLNAKAVKIEKVLLENGPDSAATATIIHRFDLAARQEVSICLSLGNITPQDFFSTVQWTPGSGASVSLVKNSTTPDQPPKRLLIHSSKSLKKFEISYRQSVQPWRFDRCEVVPPPVSTDQQCRLRAWVFAQNPTPYPWTNVQVKLRDHNRGDCGELRDVSLSDRSAGLFVLHSPALPAVIARETFVFELPGRKSGSTTKTRIAAKPVLCLEGLDDFTAGLVRTVKALYPPNARLPLAEGILDAPGQTAPLWPKDGHLEPNSGLCFLKLTSSSSLAIEETQTSKEVPTKLTGVKNGQLCFGVERTTVYLLNPGGATGLHRCLFWPTNDEDWSFIDPKFLEIFVIDHPHGLLLVQFTEKGANRAKLTDRDKGELEILHQSLGTKEGREAFAEAMSYGDAIEEAERDLNEAEDQLAAEEGRLNGLIVRGSSHLHPALTRRLAIKIESLQRQTAKCRQELAKREFLLEEFLDKNSAAFK